MPRARQALLGLALVGAACVGPRAGEGSPGLYRDLGGAAGIRDIADTFFSVAAADVRISRKFMASPAHAEKRKALLADFVCAVAGGPCEYRGKDMKAVHEGMSIDEAEFNAVIEDMREALRRHHVSVSGRNRLERLFAPMRRDMLER